MADARASETKTGRDGVEPLLREVLGRRLREMRLDRGERLVQTASRAGISPQYLSEIERGLKEPSSEMIAAVTGALGIGLLDLTAAAVAELRRREVGRTSRPQRAPGVSLYAVAA
ncbi:helix-turn-helix domain-containing protein [Frondihabitans cladoniiphilus]|uniref:HTH cro/C1-type domain-containing protein n=1 Tax=Frondihabitans cladoniiphilus TaxID=715785 RepID=A0ABP8VP79_9MICO